MPKVSLGATIPTQAYGNLQPTVECEANSIETAMEAALGHIKSLWDRTAEKPLNIDRQAPAQQVVGEILRCQISGQEVLLDADHVYRSRDGQRWLSGSKFANRYKSEFPGGPISRKMSDKHGVPADEILAMWALNAEASATFGTAVHAALELRQRYGQLSQSIKGTYESALTSNPVLRPIVDAFFEGREDENALPEVFVANPKELTCGLIDRLLIEEDGLYVEDYKTNADVNKEEKILPPFTDMVPSSSLGIYYLQLSFYSRVLMAHGRKVKGVRVHHWTGDEWKLYEHPVVNLDAAFGES